MDDRPVLLDLFCAEGGAGVGYSRAGFRIVGVDINKQKRYPFEFIQANALEYMHEHGHLYDAIHASPPCQHFSQMTKISRTSHLHPNLIPETRRLLRESGKPYIIENVPGAPLIRPVVLCGAMFQNLRVYRHRLFESNIYLWVPEHPIHVHKTTPCGRGAGENGWMSIAGHVGDVRAANVAMGCGWMSQAGIAQAIPPAYTHFLGKQLMKNVIMRAKVKKLPATP